MSFRVAFWIAALIGLGPNGAAANSTGAPAGTSGVPANGQFQAEMTCQSCHADAPLNPDEQGRVELVGLPSSFIPERRYELLIKISHPEASRWGFELTAVDAAGLQWAGDLEPMPDDRTVQRIEGGSGNRVYLTHGKSGRATGVGTSNSHEWKFIWTAPSAQVEQVIFYAAANASNADGSNFGDKVYTLAPRRVPRDEKAGGS